MGGVTARYYLTKHLTDHRTERLITVGSPTKGSPYARAWKWKMALIEQSKDANFVTKPLLDKGLEILASVENDVPLQSPAIRDLMRPEDGGEFMNRVGYAAHPLDVQYGKVVGKVELLKETQNLPKTAAMDVMRRVLALLVLAWMHFLSRATESSAQKPDHQRATVVSSRQRNARKFPALSRSHPSMKSI